MTDTTSSERIWAYQDGQGHGYFYRRKERDCCVPYIREDISDAREAAAYEAAAQEMVNWGTLHCGHEDVTDEILRDIRALATEPQRAALDRLIAGAYQAAADYVQRPDVDLEDPLGVAKGIIALTPESAREAETILIREAVAADREAQRKWETGDE